MYKGKIFLPQHKSTWELIAPLITEVGYSGSKEGDVDSILESLGLQLVKHDPTYQSTFMIPVGSKFKVKYKKAYGGDIINYLEFTQSLNKNGPITGGFYVEDPEISIEAQQLS